jgi:hypothetical protein
MVKRSVGTAQGECDAAADRPCATPTSQPHSLVQLGLVSMLVVCLPSTVTSRDTRLALIFPPVGTGPTRPGLEAEPRG